MAGIIKWRGMSQPEILIWAHLRLDKIEKKLGINNYYPDLEEITYKLESEATEKDTYTYKSEFSILKEALAKFFINFNSRARYFINSVSSLYKRKS